MKIKRTAVGNNTEAYIEPNFKEGLNIISSDDNNKGKTIVIQSMMYALGNEPAFPKSFNYNEYYHYIEFEVGDVTYFLCRRQNVFVLKHDSTLMIFDNVSELKRYWHKKIFKLPSIIKNEVLKVVDPVLFLQIFFVGQDKKDTSNISNSSYYKKDDFYNMLFDFFELSGIHLNEEEIEKIKAEINILKNDKALLLKQHRILKSKDTPVSYLSSTNDKIAFGRKLAELERIKSKIEELRSMRNNIATRRAKWSTTAKELRSLNRTIDCGELRCMDCDSTNILFSTNKKNSYTFDVSSVDMRSEIIDSIKDKIDSYTEELEKIDKLIFEAQEDMNTLMDDEEISLESIVAYKQDVFSASDAEEKLIEIENTLEILKNKLKSNSDDVNTKKEKQQELINNIVDIMKELYEEIDPSGNLTFDDLFTKKGEIYSGSEATVFHLIKLYAIQKVLGHDYPIIVDSFRAEDLSTRKENIVIDIYKRISNQTIFTTTLKDEELGKYNKRRDINHIDYIDHQPSKMLTDSYVNEFQKLIKNLSVNF